MILNIEYTKTWGKNTNVVSYLLPGSELQQGRPELEALGLTDLSLGSTSYSQPWVANT